MRTYKTKEVTKTERAVDQIHCDKCGKDVTTEYRRGGNNAYDIGWFECRFGYRAQEFGDGHTAKMDLCENCSKELLDLLRDNGFAISIESWGY